MRKLSKVLLALALVMMVFSASAFALENKVKDPTADWEFGDEKDHWGLVYFLGYDEDGLEEEGKLTPYFKVREKDGPRNRTIKGAYIRDGQEVDTTLGFRLGINYSPYIASFHGNNRIIGVRVGEFVYDLGVVTLGIDGGYMFSHFAIGDNDNTWRGRPTDSNIFGPRRNDILLNTKVGILDLVDVNVALNSYANPNTDTTGDDADKLYDRYVNVAVELGAEDIIPGLDLTGLYAFYSQDEDWLYEVTASYEVLPETLKVWAGHRNSVFWDDKEAEVEGDWNKVGVVGGNNAGNAETRYINNTDTLRNLWRRGNSINVGAEYKFVYDIVSATVKAEYDTTNPASRDDLDDLAYVSLDTKALDFSLFQKASVLIPDEDSVKREGTVEDATANRYSYELDFSTPKYTLPVPMADEVFAVGRINFDWDKNYVADNRNQVIASVELGAQADVWRLDDMYFGAILAYDLPSQEVIEDAFKFALISKYDAPNGIGFRLEYQSSIDFATGDVEVGGETGKWIHDKNLNDRYDDIRYYDNSKFHGIRFTVGFPI